MKYHAVIANPPYIVPRTADARGAYRARYVAASGKYGMGAPFTERFFELLEDGGVAAQLTSNAFMKREYGRALIEQVLPHYDTTHVIDTAGAYIPGHGTPTCILVTRNRPPSNDRVWAVMSKRGEPSTPADHVGLVWASIAARLGVAPQTAPDGPTPAGARWAHALGKLAQWLSAEVFRDAKKSLSREDAATVAASWITGASALVAIDAVLARCSGHALPHDEHLGRSFERVGARLPFNDFFDADAGVAPWARHAITAEQSDRVRAEVRRVVRPSTIRGGEVGRTDWIGDLYQGLDDEARGSFAFCQTPWFVSEALALLSVNAALREFGPGATVLDPSCGAGHLMIEAFWRLFLRRADPDDGGPEHTRPTCARMALAQTHGWEINPVAAALAQFRLVLAWIDAAEPRHLGLVPDDLPISVRVCDTLLADRAKGRVDHAKRWPAAPAAPSAEPLVLDATPESLELTSPLAGLGTAPFTVGDSASLGQDVHAQRRDYGPSKAGRAFEQLSLFGGSL